MCTTLQALLRKQLDTGGYHLHPRLRWTPVPVPVYAQREWRDETVTSLTSRTLACAGVVLLMAPSVPASAQSKWDRYQPGTIEEVIAQHEGLVRSAYSGVEMWSVTPNNFPRRARVQYLGDSRPTDPRRRALIELWVKTTGRSPAIAELFEREYLFREGERELWLPVQAQVAGFFPAELEPGGMVTLMVIWIGSHYVGEEITWAFLVNEFSVPPK